MNNLYILCGIPGCGKSTWTKVFLPNVQVVSSDEIRATICGDENDQSKNSEVFELFHASINGCLELGHDVVADATHLTDRSRDQTRRDARKPGAKRDPDTGAILGGDRVHLVFFTNVTQAIMRNATRDRKVPENVMYRMLDNYERTKLSIPGEPYDSVITIADFRGSSA